MKKAKCNTDLILFSSEDDEDACVAAVADNGGLPEETQSCHSGTVCPGECDIL